MKTMLALLMVIGFTTLASAQVMIVDDPRDNGVIVEHDKTATRSAVLTPVPGKKYTTPVMRVEGAIGRAPGSMVRIRLGDDEQLVVVDRSGRFQTTVALQKIGVNLVKVSMPDTTFVVPVLYTPPIKALTLSAPRQTLKPDETLRVSAIATVADGSTQPLDPTLVTWRSDSLMIGSIDTEGQFTARRQGNAMITGTYGTTKDRLQLTVERPDPPPATGGLTNMVTHSRHVIVEVWDSAEEDGDLISLYLNGKPVAEFVELFHKPKAFQITLEPGDNRLTVRAENEGQSPPNTGSISIQPEGESAVVQEFIMPEKTNGECTITLRP